MRRVPSTSSVSLPAACRLSRPRALVKVFSVSLSRLLTAFLEAALAASLPRAASSSSSATMCEYQTSSSCISA